MAKATKKHTTAKKTGRPAPDPILDLIAQARKRIDEFYLACEVARKLRQKLGDHNCGPAEVSGLEYFGAMVFSLPQYSSLRQIDGGREFAERRVRQALAGNQKELKRKKIRDVERTKLLAMIARDKFALHQIAEAADWLKAQWRRREARLGRLRVRSGYERAATRRVQASSAAVQAVRAIGQAKPRAVEGAAALVKFIADHCDEQNTISEWVGYELGGFNAALDSAHDALKRARNAAEQLRLPAREQRKAA